MHDLVRRDRCVPDGLLQRLDGDIEPDPVAVLEAVGDRLCDAEHADWRARHRALLNSGTICRFTHVERLHAWTIDPRRSHAPGQRNLHGGGDLRPDAVVVQSAHEAEHCLRDPSHHGDDIWVARQRRRGEREDTSTEYLDRPVVPHPVERACVDTGFACLARGHDTGMRGEDPLGRGDCLLSGFSHGIDTTTCGTSCCNFYPL